MKILNENTQIGQNILDVESLMNQYDLSIEIRQNKLHMVINGEYYQIGRDGSEFPRTIDEPLIKEI